MRKLASIQRVKAIDPIPGADSIERLTVLGWYCVSVKGTFQVGDLCVFVEPDAQISPEGPFAFLAGKNVRTSVEGRIDPVLKTIKLKGQISQGLAIPVRELFTDAADQFSEGWDVTEFLGITKWELPVPLEATNIRCKFPSGVPKTDEDRIQLFPDILLDYRDMLFHATLKYDGMSMTVYNDDGDFHVCSRNWSLKPGGAMWSLAERYHLFDILLPGTYLQAECYGESIQGNPHKIKGQDMAVFNLGSINPSSLASPSTLESFCKEHHLPKAQNLQMFYGRDHDMDSLIAMADSTGLEGVVIRPDVNVYDARVDGYLSFKAVSPRYLLKHD